MRMIPANTAWVPGSSPDGGVCRRFRNRHATHRTVTTEAFADGLVFGLATQACVIPPQSSNDVNAMINAVRELAYDCRYADARAVLNGWDVGGCMVLSSGTGQSRTTKFAKHAQTLLSAAPANQTAI